MDLIYKQYIQHFQLYGLRKMVKCVNMMMMGVVLGHQVKIYKLNQ